MEKALEEQLLKVLNKISKAEKTKNRALVRQTSRLIRALFYMKAVIGTHAVCAGGMA